MSCLFNRNVSIIGHTAMLISLAIRIFVKATDNRICFILDITKNERLPGTAFHMPMIQLFEMSSQMLKYSFLLLLKLIKLKRYT